MEEGRMVLCRDLAAWKALRVRTMKEYGDRVWWRSIYRRGLRRRLLEEAERSISRQRVVQLTS